NTSLTQCETSEGETLFNLTEAQSQLVTNPQEYSFLYFLSQDDAQNNLNPIENPDSFIFSNQNQMIYARVSNAFGCFSIAEIFLFTTNNTFQNPDDLESCDPNFDGFGIFDLTQNISTIENQLPVGATYILFSSYKNALLNSNPIDVQEYQNYQATNNQTIYIKITANGECFGIMWFNLVVHSFDEEDLQSETVFICKGENLVLSAPNGYFDYQWNLNNQIIYQQNITIEEPASYTVSFKNEFGCEATKTYIVSLSSKAQILSVEVNDFNQNGGTATVYVQGNGVYEFSINGIHYQQDNVFTNLPVGQHLVFVRDINGCGITTHPILVLDYPKYFTPNGDGINDFWRIP